MRRMVIGLVLTLSVATSLVAGGCGRASSTVARYGSLETSIALPASGTVRVSGKTVRGGATLSLQLPDATASVNETVTARVGYSNPSTSTAVILAPGGSFYNVRVTSSDGRVVFDSWPWPAAAGLPPVFKQLAPGASMSGSVSFSLKNPGTYGVVAYLNGPATPPVSLTVSE